MSKLYAVISIAFSCKLHPSGTGGGQNQTMKCNVCKYYLPQVGLIDGLFPLWEKLKFKSSLSHQHTLLFKLHYSLQALHYLFHLASHFVTWFIYKEPLKVSIIIIIVIIIILSFFGCEDWGLNGLLLRHLLPSLWFWGVCVACHVLSQSSDTWTKTLTWGQTAPPVSLRAPQLLSALGLNSTSAETTARMCLVKTSSWHFANTEGILWQVYWNPSLVLQHLCRGYTAACQVHKLSFGQHLMFTVSVSGRQSHLSWLPEHHQTGGQPE